MPVDILIKAFELEYEGLEIYQAVLGKIRRNSN